MYFNLAFVLSIMAMTTLARPGMDNNLAALCGTVNGEFIAPLFRIHLIALTGNCYDNGCAGNQSANKVTCTAVYNHHPV
jgi:hypothetical protein